MYIHYEMHEAVLGRFVFSMLRSFPMNPRKKTLIPYLHVYLEFFRKKTLSKILQEML